MVQVRGKVSLIAALYLIDLKPNPELRTTIYLIYFPTVDIAMDLYCICASPASQLCVQEQQERAVLNPVHAGQGCPSEPRGGRWTSALRWGAWGSPAVQVPRGPRGTYEGWNEGHRTFALDALSKGNSVWREKDKLVGLSGTLSFLKLNFPNSFSELSETTFG